jgi:plastocyanin
MKRLGLVLLLLTASILVAACAQQTPEPVTYTIQMSEYAFTPDTIEAKVGQQVTLELVNNGTLEHELMFGRDVMMMDNRPNGYRSDMFLMANVEPQVIMMDEGMSGMGESVHGAGHTGFMLVLPKTRDKATLTFTVTENMQGEWEYGCFSQEGVHYDAGMKGKFVVKP